MALTVIVIYAFIERASLKQELLEIQRKLNEQSHNARYKESLIILHGILHRLRDELYRLEKNPPDYGNNYDETFCQFLLDSLQSIFTRVTGAECRTCIKAFGRDADTVVTLQRDCLSVAHQAREDLRQKHRISYNTDFSLIVSETQKYFFSNDLEKYPNYKNDSPDWKTLYRSAIVWPIRCFDKAKDRYEQFGFLCVDSLQTGVFSEDADVWIGACVADMIFTYLHNVDI
ncbi:MAG: hypothetical protein NTX50_10375 [Candidatus Sumerlaeota bacterium]|nr:hypothetical protein [Candidatus Sumerlaeota bacterium]